MVLMIIRGDTVKPTTAAARKTLLLYSAKQSTCNAAGNN